MSKIAPITKQNTIDQEKTTRNHPIPPIKLYQQIFCKYCDIHCNPTERRFQNCVLTLIADELARTRQLQQHTRNLSW